jgi:hypothetical protein
VKLFTAGFDAIEKQNFTTKALKQAYKNKKLRLVWKSFCLSVSRLLKDGSDEAITASEWRE